MFLRLKSYNMFLSVCIFVKVTCSTKMLKCFLNLIAYFLINQTYSMLWYFLMFDFMQKQFLALCDTTLLNMSPWDVTLFYVSLCHITYLLCLKYYFTNK